MVCNNRLYYNEIINYKATAAVLSSEDGQHYVSSCDNNLCNNPIDKKTYIKDGVEYLFWYLLDDL